MKLCHIRTLLLVVCCCLTQAVSAGVLTKEAIQKFFPDAIKVGDKDAKLPVWPIYKLDGWTEDVVAYVFESRDLAPVPGFAGEPINLLVALDKRGEFLEVRVLSQHEPVFLDGLGPEPLFRFVEQYKGKNLRQNIKVGSNLNSGERAGGANVYVDGVSKATASVKIVNESVLAASLKVARAKLGYSAGKASSEVAQVRPEIFTPQTWQELLDAGLVGHVRLSRAQVDALFKGTVAEDVDENGQTTPIGKGDGLFIDLWYAYLNVPEVGRNLLGEEGFRKLQSQLDTGQHALWFMSAGPYSFVGPGFITGNVPDRLALSQGGLPIDLRDMDFDLFPALTDAPRGDTTKTFRIKAQAGLDPAQPLHFALVISRKKGQIFPEVVTREVPFELKLPERYFTIPESEATAAWKSLWRARQWDVAITLAGLLLLTIALVRQDKLAARPRLLAAFRWGYLSFTLGFIGWYAQAQLSIVTVMGAAKALRPDGDLSFLLYDPPSLLIWAFTLVSLLIWGRGTFCGWLCPFGALQEFSHKLARLLRLPRLRVSDAWDRHLIKLKYLALPLVIAAPFLLGPSGDGAAEVEPFKTAITLMFHRAWPAVTWAALLLLLAAVEYKPFCRWLCPLGALFALLGRLRRHHWLQRRTECGSACQLCRHRCEYRAIRHDGSIRYDECFQCLDCVAIYHDRKQCAPLLLFDRKGKAVILPAKAQASEAATINLGN